MKKLRVLSLIPEGQTPPDSLKGKSDKEIAEWKMEYDVFTALDHLGHEMESIEVSSDLGVIRAAIQTWKPHIAFNMLEAFHGVAVYDQHVVSYLELLKKPYTGCNPRGLLLAHDKALSKKILKFHRIHVPKFAVFPRGRKVRRPARLHFPLFVKSVVEEGSMGISQASRVENDKALADRIAFVHDSVGSDAIVEEYIEGRELYVGMLGNLRLTPFPIWELLFTKMPDDVPRIATAKVKWDLAYQEKHGILTNPAEGLSPGVADRILKVCKKVYRVLFLSGYARMDLRLTPDGRVFVLEANPNPDLSADEDFALAAEAGGIPYNDLIQRILNLGLAYRAEWKGMV